MRELFDTLFRIQARGGLRLLIIGGWALQAHGYARNTVDVDCLAAVEDQDKLAVELGRSGFETIESNPPFRRFRHRLDPSLVLDVMRVNEETFAKMWEASQPYDVGALALRVPALTHLIALKLHAARNPHRRGKDLEDVRQLLAANAGKVSPEEVRQLCEKFGTPEMALELNAN